MAKPQPSSGDTQDDSVEVVQITLAGSIEFTTTEVEYVRGEVLRIRQERIAVAPPTPPPKRRKLKVIGIVLAAVPLVGMAYAGFDPEGLARVWTFIRLIVLRQ